MRVPPLRLEVVKRSAHVLGQRIKLRDDPPVQLRPFGERWEPDRRLRRELVNVRVCDKERVNIPERDDELAPDVVSDAVTEIQVGRRVLPSVHPPHRVHAHAVGRLLKHDGVALALVHLVAVLVAHDRVAEDRAAGLAVFEHCAHGKQRIEPVPNWPGKLSDIQSAGYQSAQ